MSFSNLFTELRRRNVIRAALAYLAAAWLVIQLVNEIGPILDAPEGLPRLVLALLGAGFCVVVILSWFYDFTNEGIRSAGEVARDASLRPAGGRKLDFFIIGALLLAAGYFAWESRFAGPDEARGGHAIAVLPFRDLSPTQDQAWFADGMAEEILNAISRVPGLRVAGRTSSFTFRDTHLGPELIAEQLHVSHLLEGGVRTSGDQVRVTAQLVDARNGLLLWSDEFDGRLSEVFAFQDEISRRVVAGMRASLDEAPAARAKTGVDAYREYLLGRYQLARRTGEAIAEARAHFEAAVEMDAAYSPAWSALATTLAVSPWYGPVDDPAGTAREAREAAQRALALDAANSEAWAALGTVYQTFERDWQGAEQALQRAIDLDPDDAGTANLYGDFAYVTGNYDAAEEWERTAAELEPLSAVHQHELALVYGLTGRVKEAIALEQRAVELNPDFNNGWQALGRFHAQSGDAGRLEQLLQARGSTMGEASALFLAARLHQLRGESAQAHDRADALLQRVRESGGSLLPAALTYAELGDGERAASLVREAQAVDDPLLISPIYFFLPEDWGTLPDLERALTQPGLAELHARRRANIAAGHGRTPSRL